MQAALHNARGLARQHAVPLKQAHAFGAGAYGYHWYMEERRAGRSVLGACVTPALLCSAWLPLLALQAALPYIKSINISERPDSDFVKKVDDGAEHGR